MGGVVGGIVGGTAPPPPKSTGPKLLTTKAGHSLLAINPQRAPVQGQRAGRVRQRGATSTSHRCASACPPQGTVSSVKILKPSIPVIDLQIPRVIPRWKYKPYLVDGRPTAFCYPMNYRVTLIGRVRHHQQ